MEFTQEKIDSLKVNEVQIMNKIADELNIKTQQVSAVRCRVQVFPAYTALLPAER